MKNLWKNKKNIILLGAAVIAAVLSIILPEKLIEHKKRELTNVCMDVPEEYYPVSSYYEVIKEFSEKLTEYQKRQLISGVWASEVSEVDKEFYEDSGYHIEEKSRDIISRLSEKGYYPVSVVSSYKQWYSWKCTYMQALDTNFRSYAGFYWKVEFSHFEGGEHMNILMTPEGRLINAEYIRETGISDEKKSLKTDLSHNEYQELTELMLGSDFEVTNVKDASLEDKEIIAEHIQAEENDDQKYDDQKKDDILEDIEAGIVTVKDNSDESSDQSEKSYYLYNFSTTNSFSFGLMPVE